MKIWQRYLFGQLARTFFFLLICLFLLYVMVDLSAHGVRFLSSSKTTLSEIALYYLRNFAQHLELFLPLTLLLSSLRVLLDLNAHQELVALQMAGLSQKTLLRPFFLFAALLSLAGYVNSQWFSPDAQEAASAFRTTHSKKTKKIKKEPLYSIALDDESELVYQSFDETKWELFDVFWVRSSDDIWHMKYLQIRSDHPEGRYVDHLQRNNAGQLEKTESFDRLAFLQLPWDDEATLDRFIPFENRPLSTLIQQAAASSAEKQRVFAHLHYKIALPTIPFFILLAICPIAMRFNRRLPAFLIVAISIASFVGFMTILSGMLILGETQVIPGSIAIWGPIGVLLLFLFPRFVKL